MPETPPIDPELSALIVVDYEPPILTLLSEATPLFKRLAEPFAVARQARVHVACVPVAFDDADDGAIPTTSKAFAPSPVPCPARVSTCP
jgi:hypothetical protein